MIDAGGRQRRAGRQGSDLRLERPAVALWGRRGADRHAATAGACARRSSRRASSRRPPTRAPSPGASGSRPRAAGRCCTCSCATARSRGPGSRPPCEHMVTVAAGVPARVEVHGYREYPYHEAGDFQHKTDLRREVPRVTTTVPRPGRRDAVGRGDRRHRVGPRGGHRRGADGGPRRLRGGGLPRPHALRPAHARVLPQPGDDLLRGPHRRRDRRDLRPDRRRPVRPAVGPRLRRGERHPAGARRGDRSTRPGRWPSAPTTAAPPVAS